LEPLEFIEPLANDSDSMEINPNCKGKEPFDSTFAVLHWIISCKNGMSLLKCDINNLTFKVLFRKSFRLDEVIIKSTTDCENLMLPCILKKTDG
jgi:hypothetical protein